MQLQSIKPQDLFYRATIGRTVRCNAFTRENAEEFDVVEHAVQEVLQTLWIILPDVVRIKSAENGSPVGCRKQELSPWGKNPMCLAEEMLWLLEVLKHLKTTQKINTSVTKRQGISLSANPPKIRSHIPTTCGLQHCCIGIETDNEPSVTCQFSRAVSLAAANIEDTSSFSNVACPAIGCQTLPEGDAQRSAFWCNAFSRWSPQHCFFASSE